MISLLLPIIYLAFISLGLPDSLLGSVWPNMYQQFNVSLSASGLIFMIIAFGTILSSLASDYLSKKLSTGLITFISVAMTCIALFGFSISDSYIKLCLWAIPYGLGAGSVDAALNNYVALHYKSHHMSWLHCMWGIGASSGPYIMGLVLSKGYTWNKGYLTISIIQLVLTIILFISLPLWKNNKSVDNTEKQENKKPLTVKQILSIPGAVGTFIAFFCYSAVEQTTSLWASSYLVLHLGIDASLATTFASLFFIGITVGRFINGFITFKLNDRQLIYLGCFIILAGIICLLIPVNDTISLIGLILIGLGCAPIYPCIIHSTPDNFGADNSQAMIGIQMASAYIGTCLMPPLFGLIANNINISLFPYYLLLVLLILSLSYTLCLKAIKKNRKI